ncbi:demethoxyubiquinone hydroxylase family protein [Thiosocius teredinicola]|uniref:demethoxyubiquinone hydroxylase family protein n=1 Tax=Thiosocius teredinicola TaxID=1973002 RepID=UPI00099101ED
MELSKSKVDGERETPGRILKVDHAGEFGAVNIYRAQIFVGTLYGASHLPVLREFLEHEKRHLAVFGGELKRRGIRRCKSYYLCGVGGYCLGLVSAIFGRSSVMACTAAVETVVLRHLEDQLQALSALGDIEAYQAVSQIIQDEQAHQEAGRAERVECLFYKPFVAVVEAATEAVIWLGMRL